MPFCYGYARVSHQSQIAGDSRAAQAKRAQQYWKSHLEELGIEWVSVVEEQDSVSAYRVPFKARKGGARLLKMLQPGDHVVFDKIDRVWRSSRDFADLHQWFRENNVTFHITNLMGCSLVSDSPMGEFMLRLMVSIAELEAATISNRTKAALKHEVESGYFPRKHNTKLGVVGKCPGLKVVEAVPRVLNRRGEPKKMLAWDEKTRSINRQIVELRRGIFKDLDENKAFKEISTLIHAAYGDGKQYRYPANRLWNPARCKWCFILETEIYPAIIDPRYADVAALMKLREGK